MKRVLIDGMSCKEGGVEHFIYQLYNLIKDDCHVDFITIDKEIPFQDYFTENGSTIHRITPRYVNLKTYKEDIDNVFKNNKYDVLWFNKMSLSSIDCLISAKKNGVGKIISHSHASNNMGNQFTLLMHRLNRMRVNRFVDVKLACSISAAKWMYGNNISDVTVFPNAIDLSKYVLSKDIRNEKRKELNVEDKFTICHIGRFSDEKNHKFLIDVFKKLLDKIDARLVLCGQGDLFEDVKQYAKDSGVSEKILFLGMRRDIPEILQASDLLVLPSKHEGFPITLVEAQASGVPCVVSDVVSREVQLTDIIDFVSLEDDLNKWVDAIMKYKDYNKVDKTNEIEEKGFGLQSMESKVKTLLEI